MHSFPAAPQNTDTTSFGMRPNRGQQTDWDQEGGSKHILRRGDKPEREWGQPFIHIKYSRSMQTFPEICHKMFFTNVVIHDNVRNILF